MALVDSNYRFTMVDVGATGSDRDSYVFCNSALGMQFMNDTLPLPSPKGLSGSKTIAPFVLVGDEAFPPKENLLKPFSCRSITEENIMQRVFNYHLSQARMTVECAFGIMTQCFRCLSHKMSCSYDTAEAVVKAVCILYNYLLKKDLLASEVQQDMYKLGKKLNYAGSFKPFTPRGHHPSQCITAIRNVFTQHFMATIGEVPWQYRCVYVENPS